jgi:chemotaxis protein CheX
MITEAELDSFRGDVAALVESVYSSMLGIELRALPPDAWTPEPELTGSLEFSGAWHGKLMLGCTRAQAFDWAVRWTHNPDPPEDDVRDMVGELANIIGGNLKPLLPKVTRIAFPSVSNGDFDANIAPFRLCFEAGGEPFAVSVLQRD